MVLVCGEGGSGGALGIAIGDRVLMQEFSVYSVIPPEGCAAILWRDASRKVEAAAALKLTAPDMLALGLIDGRAGAHGRSAQQSRRGDRARGPGADCVSGRGVCLLGRNASQCPLRQVPQDGGSGHGVRRYPAMKSLLWHHLPCNDDQATALAAALGVHPIVARLLCLRGMAEPDEATRFLNPSMDHLHDPFKLADMDRAVERLERALAQHERIAITVITILKASVHGFSSRDGLLGADVVHSFRAPRDATAAVLGDRSAARENSVLSCRLLGIRARARSGLAARIDRYHGSHEPGHLPQRSLVSHRGPTAPIGQESRGSAWALSSPGAASARARQLLPAFGKSPHGTWPPSSLGARTA